MSKRIVLIDDDPEDIEIMMEVLKDVSANYSTIAFNDPCYAIEVLEGMPFNLLPHYIVLDVQMPTMDGLECLMKLRQIERLKDVAYIVHSTSPPAAEMAKAFKNLGAEVHTKPNTMKEFREFFRRQTSKE